MKKRSSSLLLGVERRRVCEDLAVPGKPAARLGSRLSPLHRCRRLSVGASRARRVVCAAARPVFRIGRSCSAVAPLVGDVCSTRAAGRGSCGCGRRLLGGPVIGSLCSAVLGRRAGVCPVDCPDRARQWRSGRLGRQRGKGQAGAEVLSSGWHDTGSYSEK